MKLIIKFPPPPPGLESDFSSEVRVHFVAAECCVSYDKLYTSPKWLHYLFTSGLHESIKDEKDWSQSCPLPAEVYDKIQSTGKYFLPFEGGIHLFFSNYAFKS